MQFTIKKGREITRGLSIREKVNHIELSAIKHLLEKFLANKIRLIDQYKQKDPDNTGGIALADWCNITESTLELNLPWRLLRPKLAKVNAMGLVLYESTFEGLSISNNKQKQLPADNNVIENMYRHKEILESVFRAIDTDHSGI